MARRLAALVPPLLVFTLTLAVFLPVLENGFVNWDDEANLLQNPHYRGLGWEHLKWMFSTIHMSLYRPLTWVTFGLDFLLWGMDPWGYHLTSLLLHALAAVLVYFLAVRLIGLAGSGGSTPASVLGALVAALFFALHPLRVEAVAWLSARNDLVAGLFLICSALCYLRYVGASPGRGRKLALWTSSLTSYGLSLLGKGAGLTYPFLLLALDVYPLRRLGGERGWFGRKALWIWLEKLPFLALAVAAAVVGYLAKEETGAARAFSAYGLLPRLLQTSFGVVFYLLKSVLPLGLSPLYQFVTDIFPSYWPIGVGERLILLGSAALTVLVTLGCFIVRRRWPAALLVWIAYVALLVPFVGIAQSGPQIVADRYAYLPAIPWAVLVGGLWLRGWTGLYGSVWPRLAVAATTAVALTVLSGISVRQIRVWQDSEKLWKHALAVSESGLAHFNLASWFLQQGRLAEAAVHLRRVTEVSPEWEVGHRAFAGLLSDTGKLDEAIHHLRRALEIDPADPVSHYNLANTLARKGELKEAVTHYREAVRLEPNYVAAYGNLGNVLAMQGDFQNAIAAYEQALKIKPDLVTTRFNLGLAFLQAGDSKSATAVLEEVIQAQPEFIEARFYLGGLLASEGKMDQAGEHFREILRLRPDFVDAHVVFARLLAAQGKRKEAERHYEEALRILKAQKQRQSSSPEG